jgi:hypothetical protein
MVGGSSEESVHPLADLLPLGSEVLKSDINDFSAFALGLMDRPTSNIIAGAVPNGVLIQGPSLPSTFTVENWNPSRSLPAVTTTEYVFSSVPSQRTSPTLISVIGTLTGLIWRHSFTALEVLHVHFLLEGWSSKLE